MLKNTYRSLLTLGFSILYLFSTPVLSTTTYTPGDTAGKFEVDKHHGQATYQFPIVVPPGTGSMVPSLSLNYNSGAGNGLMGMGWTLDGLSVITRCPATKFTDGSADPVDFDEHDRYCLDGQRLILITSGSTNGAHESEYRTAIVDPENFSKVIAYNTDSNKHGPEYFKVWTKSGQIMEYGVTADSRIEAQGQVHVRLWAVNKITDTAGNYLTITYTEDSTNGSYRPNRINYTGNANATPALSPYNSVRFTYQARTDKVPSWLAGSKIINTHRLSHIKTYTGNTTVVRDYRLAYEYSPTSKRSRLLSITECSGDTDTPCLPPITFQWPTKPATAYTETAAYALPEPLYDSDGNRKGQLIDLNADSLPDYVHGTTIWLNKGIVTDDTIWQQATGNDHTLPDAVDSKHGQFVDVNGDGYPDWVRAYHENDQDYQATYINTRSTSIYINGSYAYHYVKFEEDTDYALPDVIYNGTQVNGQFADVNGDKRPDWVRAYRSGNTDNKTTYINTGSGWQQNTAYTLPTVMYYGNRLSGQFVDVNGNGLPDWVQAYRRYDGLRATYINTYINTGSGWQRNTAYTLPYRMYLNDYVYGQLIDVNGDGLTDWVRGEHNLRYTFINTGTGWRYHFHYNLPTIMYRADDHNLYGRLVDVNGDGRPDWVRAYRRGGTDYETTYINTGTSWQEDNHYTLPALISDSTGTRGEFTDINGDGMMDWVQGYTSGSTEYKKTWLNNYAQTDVITGITTGLVSQTTGLGPQTQISYKPLTTGHSVYEKGSSATYPEIDIRPPMYVVSSIRVTDGLGQQLQTDYRYSNARTHRDHGFLGFYDVRSTELATGLESRTAYSLGYRPHIGKIVNQSQRIPVPQTDGRTITRRLNVNFFFISSRRTHAGVGLAAGHPGVLFVYTSATQQYFRNPYDRPIEHYPQSISRAYYGHQKRIDTYYTYDNFGSPTSIREGTNTYMYEHSVALSRSRLITNTYHHDSARWLLGRLTRTTVTSQYPRIVGCTILPGGACTGSRSSRSRTSSFTYNSTTGLLTQETIEPDTPALRQITSYTRDAFGNILTTTVSGGENATAVAARTTTNVYDSKGRFATRTTNALGHTETRTYDAGFGNLLSLTDPNAIATNWTYDNFGRQTKETRADGTTTTITREWCQDILNQAGAAHCPSIAALVQTTATTGAPKTRRYSDRLGRVIRTQTQGFDGRWSTIDTEYNRFGDQVTLVSEPYYPGDTAYWETTQYQYDLAGRISSITATDDSLTRSTYGLQGMKITVTNAKNQTKTVIYDVLGLPALVIENGNTGTAIRNHYDVFGNLVLTCKGTDPCSSTDTSAIKNTYDIRGNKISTTDPDRGAWTYQYNAVGELIKQTNAKEQVTTFSYDKLGRMTERREPEGTATWNYDTATKGKGKLASVSYTYPNNQVGKQESYSYDDDGRLVSTVTTIDGTSYTTSQTYDTSGRLDVLTYPAPGSAGGFSHPNGLQVQHHYNAQGYLRRISNTNDYHNRNVSRDYWKAEAMNARGQLTRYRYGNGITIQRNYSPQTGRIQRVVNNDRWSRDYIDISYQFDNLGNLTQRRSYSGNKTETFQYDNLNRMTQSTLTRTGATTTTKTYSYDNRGNITSKTGIGNYTYGSKVGSTLNAGGIHAVINAGGNTIQYDANGNVTSNRNFTAVDDRTIEWTSYNKAKKITQGSTTINSHYGANRELYKRITRGTTGTTTRIYISPLSEKEGDTHIRYIKAMGQTIAIFKDNPNIPNLIYYSKLRYLHHDYLGSVVAVSSSISTVIDESLNYDPWGKRRQTSWRDATAQLFSRNLDKGFTGHHHLDKVGLIDMGGRLYDPDLGRFLSADPFIQAPDNSQSYNRYSYALNNPLSYADPRWAFLQEAILKEAISLGTHISTTR